VKKAELRAHKLFLRGVLSRLYYTVTVCNKASCREDLGNVCNNELYKPANLKASDISHGNRVSAAVVKVSGGFGLIYI